MDRVRFLAVAQVIPTDDEFRMELVSQGPSIPWTENDVGELFSVAIDHIAAPSDIGPYLTPVLLGYDDFATCTHISLACYPDRLMLDGKPATDAQAAAFLKDFAAHQVALREEAG